MSPHSCIYIYICTIVCGLCGSMTHNNLLNLELKTSSHPATESDPAMITESDPVLEAGSLWDVGSSSMTSGKFCDQAALLQTVSQIILKNMNP